MIVVHDDRVGRPKTENTEQLVIRVPKAVRDRLLALVPRLARAGISITMTDAARAALVRGIEVLETETGSEPKPRRRQ
jgi:hypothetical protein